MTTNTVFHPTVTSTEILKTFTRLACFLTWLSSFASFLSSYSSFLLCFKSSLLITSLTYVFIIFFLLRYSSFVIILVHKHKCHSVPQHVFQTLGKLIEIHIHIVQVEYDTATIFHEKCNLNVNFNLSWNVLK